MTRLTGMLMLALLVAAPALGGTVQRERQRAATRPVNPNAALRRVLDVERESQAYYLAVLKSYRPIHPFGMVARMEQRHEQTLLAELEQRGIDIPANRWQMQAGTVPETREEALEQAVAMEKKTIAAYDRAIKVIRNESLRQKLEQLREESIDHRKWFEDPESCPMPGPRQGRGPGPGAGSRGPRPGRGPA